MRCAGVDLLRTLGLERSGCGHQAAGGIDHVVVEDADLVLHVADQGRDLGLVVLRAVLVHDGDVAIKQRGELLGGLCASHVGRHHAQLLGLEALLLEVVHEDGHGGHMVDRLVEEALDGVLVQIDGDDVVGASGGEQVGYQLGGDRLARSGLAVLARVTVMRDDGADAVRAGALGRVDHDEQLHEVVVDVEAIGARAHGLHDEHIGAANAFLVASVDFSVGELLQLHIAQGDAQLLCDLVGQLQVRGTRKHCHPLTLFHFRSHARAPSHRFAVVHTEVILPGGKGKDQLAREPSMRTSRPAGPADCERLMADAVYLPSAA